MIAATPETYRTLLMGTSKDPNAKRTLLLFVPGQTYPAFVVKVPSTEVAVEAVERERRMLLHLQDFPIGELRAMVPAVTGQLQLAPRALATTGLPGKPMLTSYYLPRHTSRPECVAADFAAAGQWLSQLQAATPSSECRLDLCGPLWPALTRRYHDEPGFDGVLDAVRCVNDRLAVQSTARTLVHGDFWVGNILMDGGKVTGVVDWEAGEPAGQPMRDVLRFAIAYALYLDRHTAPGRNVAGHPGFRAGRWGAGVAYSLQSQAWFPRLFRMFVQDGLARLGADPALWRECVLADLAEVAALADHPGFARQHWLLLVSLLQEPAACS